MILRERFCPPKRESSSCGREVCDPRFHLLVVVRATLLLLEKGSFLFPRAQLKLASWRYDYEIPTGLKVGFLETRDRF